MIAGVRSKRSCRRPLRPLSLLIERRSSLLISERVLNMESGWRGRALRFFASCTSCCGARRVQGCCCLYLDRRKSVTISEVSVIRLSYVVRLPSSLYWRYLIRPGWLVAVVGPVDDRARLYQGCIYWQEGGGGGDLCDFLRRSVFDFCH